MIRPALLLLSCAALMAGVETIRAQARNGLVVNSRQGAEPEAAVTLAANLAALWADPASRAELEPVGSFLEWPNRTDLPAVVAANQQWEAEASWRALVEALLARGDRLSVRAALHWMLWKDDFLWLDRAVALFPDDPEILLTKAMKNPDSPGARELFLRGLALTKQMAPLMEGSGYLWGSQPTHGWWLEAAVVMALADKAAELPPGHFPEAWCWSMRRALSDPHLLQSLPHPEKAARALLKHLPPFPEKLHEFPWPHILTTLRGHQDGNLARECATALLQVPLGPLIRTRPDLTPLSPLWRTEEYGPGPNLPASFGWKLLRLASADQPAALAATLKTTLIRRPSDESLAFHAFLAQGSERPLAAADLILLQGLPPAGRQRLLAYATHLLPLSQFPAPLWADAVVEEIRLLLAKPALPLDPQTVPILQRYLFRLQAPEAAPALARLLPLLYRERARLSDIPLPRLTGATLRHLSTEDRAAFSAAWDLEFVEGQPLPAQLQALDLLLMGYLSMAGTDIPAELPDRLGHHISSSLSGPAAQAKDPESQAAFASLCLTALHLPPWQREVRRLAAQDPVGDGWNAVHHLIDVLDNEIDPPTMELEFRGESPGQGTLTWRFLEGGVPTVSWSDAGIPLHNPLLAAAVSRQFEATISMDDGFGGPSRPLQRLTPIPHNGSITLTNLLHTGKLTFQLVSKTPGAKPGASQRVYFNTHPALIRSDGTLPAPQPPSALPLLATPVPCGDHQAWQITVDPPDSTAGFRLVLLDAAGRIHSGDSYSGLTKRDPETLDQPAGVIVLRALAEPDSPWKRLPTAQPLTMIGPPVSLALIATGEDLSALPRITVQPIPVPLPPSDKDLRLLALTKEFGQEPEKLPDLSGRLEPVRLWTPSREGPTHYFFCGQPTKIVGYHHNALLVHDPLRDDPPVPVPLPLPEPHDLQAGAWLGGKLWLVLTRANTQEGDPDLTTLMAVDPFRPSVPVETRVLNGSLKPSFETVAAGSPAISALVLEYDPTGIDTIITADGKILTLDMATRQGRILRLNRLLSPAHLACAPGADGLTPVLDWRSGTLRLTYQADQPEPAWQPGDYPVWQDISSSTSRFGIWADYTTDPFRLWEQSLKLDSVDPLSENYLLGTSNGSLVRLRKVPFPKHKK